MSAELRALPELIALERGRNWIRLPPETDIPVTPRILRLIETPAFRRLGHLSQLGLVSLVYPGATHTRLQHSLGVYKMSLLYLKSLSEDPSFRKSVGLPLAELFVVAALLHDIGHWPFCHPIEDLQLPGMPRHEALARSLILETEIADCLREDWSVTPESVADFLAPPVGSAKSVLHSMLSGPIDIDKLDYLDRDSLHAGVPYGRNFDRQRLVQSLCVGPCGTKLAITDKGRTAAEMMVFARYVMFSEVYWHHAVRSATAMLQRAVFSLGSPDPIREWTQSTDLAVTESLKASAKDLPTADLIDGLFGERRVLFKRLVQYDSHQQPEIHAALSRRPYSYLVEFSSKLAERIGARLGEELKSCDVLIDAPPVKLEVQFKIDVRQGDGSFLPLGEVSPFVRALAEQQFDDVVKKVRVFIHPRWREAASRLPIQDLIHSVLEER